MLTCWLKPLLLWLDGLCGVKTNPRLTYRCCANMIHTEQGKLIVPYV